MDHHSWQDQPTADINATSLRMVYAGLRMRGRVLDVGCNKGHLIDLLPLHNVSEYAGVDGSEEMIADAMKVACRKFHDEQARVNDAPIPHNFYRLDFEREPLPFKDRYFDSMFAGEVIEHLITGPDFLLSEMWRVLGQGGTLVLTTPLKIPGMIAIGSGHEKEYNDKEAVKLLNSHGFNVNGIYVISQNPVNYRRLLMILDCERRNQRPPAREEHKDEFRERSDDYVPSGYYGID